MTWTGGTIRPTLSLADGARRRWDAVVVGAGPGGAAAAISLARRGCEVLLLDKASFPRWKVCGCCLSEAAMHALESMGLGSLPFRLGARPLHRLDLAAGRARADIAIQGSFALSREAFDAGLVRTAIDAGVQFLDRAAASGADAGAGRLAVCSGSECATIHVGIVIAADGIAAALAPELGSRRARRSRIGLGASIDGSHAAAFVHPGTISMTVARGGYVGAVLLEDGRVNIAAAVDPAFLRRAGSAATAVADILRSAHREAPESLAGARFRGTPSLTRRRERAASHRLLALGDSAAYVEPFSGEGIAWSLHSGIGAADTASEILKGRATSDAWQQWWTTHIQPRHRRCTVLARALRCGPLVPAAVGALGLAPRLSAAVVSLFTAPARPANA